MSDAAKDAALAVIDKALTTFGGRDLVSADEMRDVLLDIRFALQNEGTPCPA